MGLVHAMTHTHTWNQTLGSRYNVIESAAKRLGQISDQPSACVHSYHPSLAPCVEFLNPFLLHLTSSERERGREGRRERGREREGERGRGREIEVHVSDGVTQTTEGAKMKRKT